MKTFLILGYSCIVFNAQAQQKTNTFHVIDGASNLSIPSASITIVRARLSIHTERNGVFRLPGNLGLIRDTIAIYAQNYTPLVFPVSRLVGADTIKLTRLSITKVISKEFKPRGNTLLNGFDGDDVGRFAGVSSETARFDYLQLAQQFDLPQSGARLTHVSVNRHTIDSYYPNGELYGKDFMPHKLRLRIYDTDHRTGGPGQDICDSVIEISNGCDGCFVNLKKNNIFIPGKTFFVAIEWLRDLHNQDHIVVYDKRRKQLDTLLTYRPFIGISPKTGKKLNIWALDYHHSWTPYTYFYPYGTDLAIRAKIEF